ncbi:Potassium channel SKOR family protein [Salix suchowensis]|nr:Potassium channel SKOR family protein [Salix suchowensis]
MARNEDLQLLDMKHGEKLIFVPSPKYSWGNTPLDEARIGGNKDLIKLLEAARASQVADDMQRMKCTVFPFHPWDPKEKRRDGVVLWVPQTIEELVKAAMEELKSSGGYILSENGGKILDVNMISHDQKLFLVDE